MSDVWKFLSGLAASAAALAATVLVPGSSGPGDGTRLGSMSPDTVLYTKAQADIVFSAQSGSVPTNMSQLVDDVGYAKTDDIPTRVSQLSNDSGFLTEHQSLAGLASTNDIPTKVSQLANDAGYATMSADYNKGSLTISAVKPGEDGLFLKIFNKDGCPAISAGTIGAAEEDLAEVYAYGAPSIDSMTNSLWTAIGRTYTQSEVEELIAQAIAAVMGPFAIEEDENGRPVMVRRESVQSLQTFLKVSNGSDTNNEQNGSFRTATQE